MMRSIRWQKTTKHGLFFKLLKKMLCVSAVATLYRFSQLCADSRTHANSGEKPSKAGETTESPQAKRRKWGERDLKFLQVKNKDSQDCLFVDLGKRNHKFVIFYPLYPELQINYKINRLSQWNVKSVQSDILKVIILSNRQSKTQRHFIYCQRLQRKVSNPHVYEARTS